MHKEIIQIILMAIQGIVGVAFILMVMSQTSKNEGFGTIGVQAPTNFKGKPGHEEIMRGLTRNIGIAWFVISLVVAVSFRGS